MGVEIPGTGIGMSSEITARLENQVTKSTLITNEKTENSSFDVQCPAIKDKSGHYIL